MVSADDFHVMGGRDGGVTLWGPIDGCHVSDDVPEADGWSSLRRWRSLADRHLAEVHPTVVDGEVLAGPVG